MIKIEGEQNIGVDDMVLLTRLNNSEIVENLKKRHEKKISYYGPDYISRYYRASSPYENAPHIFAVADLAFSKMAMGSEYQMVVVSGESGSGKTFAANRIIEYLTSIIGESHPGVDKLKNTILYAIPLLEAFGNAKTVLNDDSSRFGKCFEMVFTGGTELIGGVLLYSMLEKTRVVHQRDGERNFHIFYQLLSGCSPEDRETLKMKEPQDYYFTSCGNSFSPPQGKDDADDYKLTRNAMDEIDSISKDDQNQIFRVVSAILNLGNIIFEEQEDGTTVPSNLEPVEIAASLLGLDVQVLVKSLVVKVLHIGGEVIEVVREPEDASTVRDNLAMQLYDRIFQYLIQKINQELASGQYEKTKVIGIMDIYGFEKNVDHGSGLESLCINYLNEKLHQLFIKTIFKGDQDEIYDQDEIHKSEKDPKKTPQYNFFDNKVICDLLVGSRDVPGVFSVLESTCATSGKLESFKADLKFLSTLKKELRHEHLIVGNMCDFEIVHYSGTVNYSVQGFVEKNIRLPYLEVINGMQTTSSRFVLNLFPENTENLLRKRPITTSYRYKMKAREIIDQLLVDCNDLHFVQCIKTNENKSPEEFNVELVSQQVEDLCFLENIRLQRSRFAYRQEFRKFHLRFRVLSKYCFPKKFIGSDKEACAAIMMDSKIQLGQAFILGKTKIFIRDIETLYHLEDLKNQKIKISLNTIYRAWKRYILRRYYQYGIRFGGNHLYLNRKERRRMSVKRVFNGDYINYLNNAQLQEIMKDYVIIEGNVLFSDIVYRPKSQEKRDKLLLQKMYILVTSKSVYFLERKMIDLEKNGWRVVIDQRIRFEEIEGVGMSCLVDNFMIIRTSDSYVRDVFFTNENKTELLSILNDNYRERFLKDIPREFENVLTFQLTDDGEKKRVVWMLNETLDAERITSCDENWEVSIKTQLPPTNQPFSPPDCSTRQIERGYLGIFGNGGTTRGRSRGRRTRGSTRRRRRRSRRRFGGRGFR